MKPVLRLILGGLFAIIPGVGFVLSTLSVIVSVLNFISRRPDNESPAVAHIQALHEAKKARKEAEDASKKARELVEQIRQQTDQYRKQARARQEEADRAAAQEMKRMKERLEEAAEAAKRAEKLAKEASQAAKEAGKVAKEERERAQKMRDDAQREAAQRAAEEQRRKTETGKAKAEEMARTATEEDQKEGIQPVVMPSREEVASAKRRIQYKKDSFHFAIVGISGSGKSSLVNSFRGLRTRDAGAAAVGVKETTLQMTRYADANPENPYVWYDIPGASTLRCPDWQYFNNQGLYVFDCIIVLSDNWFTLTDIAILVNARRFNIPTYIVRSKADQHIQNVMKDMGYDSEEDDGSEEAVKRRNELHEAARRQFIEETRESVRANLVCGNLPDQRVYIVSNTTLLNIVLNKMPKKTIDEVDLLNDLINEAHKRRVT